MYEFATFGTSALALNRRQAKSSRATIVEFPQKHEAHNVLALVRNLAGKARAAFKNTDMVNSLKTESFAGTKLEGITFAQSIVATIGFTAFGVALLYLFV